MCECFGPARFGLLCDVVEFGSADDSFCVGWFEVGDFLVDVGCVGSEAGDVDAADGWRCYRKRSGKCCTARFALPFFILSVTRIHHFLFFSAFYGLQKSCFFHAAEEEFFYLTAKFDEGSKQPRLFRGSAECRSVTFGAEEDVFPREFVFGGEFADVKDEAADGAVIFDAAVVGVFYNSVRFGVAGDVDDGGHGLWGDCAFSSPLRVGVGTLRQVLRSGSGSGPVCGCSGRSAWSAAGVHIDGGGCQCATDMD